MRKLKLFFVFSGNKDTNVCSMVDIRCYTDAHDRFTKELLIRKCDCLPDCTSVTYDVEIAQGQSRYSDDTDALRNALNESM